MKLSELEYRLPREYIAQKPAQPRDHSKLLVLDRSQSNHLEHRKFYNVVDYLHKNDVLVVNNTRVIPARLIAERPSGGKAEVLLCRQSVPEADPRRRVRPASGGDDNDKTIWTALVNFNRRLRAGEILYLSSDKSIMITLLKRLSQGWSVQIEPAIDFKKLESIGKMPLPPYIKRAKDKDSYLKSDKNNYQTVYAEKDGSIAAPTAGLHFTRRLIDKLIKKGVRIVYITLHVGIGTFKPIRCNNVADHQMEQEYFEVGPEAMRTLSEAYRDRRKIIGVGTTVTRVLETIADQIKMTQMHPLLERQRVLRASMTRGWTDIFIYPPYKFKLVNSLITNFHLPHGTPLALVSAFAGRDRIMDAYQEAIKEKYRFYSYGDAMLIV